MCPFFFPSPLIYPSIGLCISRLVSSLVLGLSPFFPKPHVINGVIYNFFFHLYFCVTRGFWPCPLWALTMGSSLFPSCPWLLLCVSFVYIFLRCARPLQVPRCLLANVYSWCGHAAARHHGVCRRNGWTLIPWSIYAITSLPHAEGAINWRRSPHSVCYWQGHCHWFLSANGKHGYGNLATGVL